MELTVIAAGAFAAAFVVGVSGFADALVASAIWLQILPPHEAVPLIVATGVVMHSVSLAKLRHFERRRGAPFFIAGLLGVPVGIVLLARVDPEPFRLALGAFLLAYGTYALARPGVAVPAWGGRAADATVGLAGGVLGGLAGLSGVLPTIWSGLRGWPPDVQRGVYQPYILLMHIIAVFGFALTGALDTVFVQRLALCLPALVVGIWLGHRAYGRIDAAVFRRVILVLLLAAGVSLIA